MHVDAIYRIGRVTMLHGEPRKVLEIGQITRGITKFYPKSAKVREFDTI